MVGGMCCIYVNAINLDFRDYLPPAAGGRATATAAGGPASNPNRLGHILYVRDSEGEADSDEDPDDDLDI